VRHLHFDCQSGISGDMTLASLLDLGMPFEHLQNELRKIKLDGYKLNYFRTERHMISAAAVTVEINDPAAHRHLRDILNIIEPSSLAEKIKVFARTAFQKLADAEAKIHQTSPDKVHFHEVGALDAIIDITGAAIGLEYFRPESISISPLPLGSGSVKSAHGMIPIPAPATIEILRGFRFRLEDTAGEKVTPTGAAILATAAEIYPVIESPSSSIKIEKVGYGAGAGDFPERPNLLRLMLGELDSSLPSEREEVQLIESNIDDMNPQIYSHLMSRLYEAGALEVFMTPIIMKKNRPGTLLTLLCKNDLVDTLSDIIFRETTTAGLRIRSERRRVLPREIRLVETEYGPIRVKMLKFKDKVKIQPEYDDCAAAAQKRSVSLLDVMAAARRAAENLEGIE